MMGFHFIKSTMPPTKTKAKPSAKTPGYVYLFHAQGTNRYKIGVTRRPLEERQIEVQRQSPYPLICLKYIKVRSIFDVETVLHHKFKKNHLKIKGSKEWFRFSALQIQTQVLPAYSKLNTASRSGIIAELTLLLNWAIGGLIFVAGAIVGYQVIDLPLNEPVNVQRIID